MRAVVANTSRFQWIIRGLAIAFSVGLGVGAVFLEFERRNQSKFKEIDLKVQQAAIVRFPVIFKFLQAFPGAIFVTPGIPDFWEQRKSEPSHSFIFVDPDLKSFVVCSLPPFVVEGGGLRFEGKPVIERYENVMEDHSISARKVADLTEADLDQLLEERIQAPDAVEKNRQSHLQSRSR